MSYVVLTAAIAALLMGGLVKGATGMGLPLVALPVLAATFGLPHAIGLMTVPILVSNAWQLWLLRGAARDQALRFLPAFAIAAGIGVIGGTVLLKTLPERALTVTLGIMLLAYIALRLAKPAIRVSADLASRLGIPVGLAAGVLNGATGISAPIGVTFIHAMGLARDVHVFAVSAMFMAMAAVQVPAMAAAGLMRWEWLLQGVAALVPILLAMPLGRLLATRLSAAAFDRMIMIFLGLIGLKMVLGV